jgi:Fic family protein
MEYQRCLNYIVESTKWTQEELAAYFKVSFVTMNAWLNGRVIPRKKAQEKIYKAYEAIAGTATITDSQTATLKQHVYSESSKKIVLITDMTMQNTFMLYSVYHSPALQNSSLRFDDIEQIMYEDKLSASKPQKEQLLVKNHEATLRWILTEARKPDFAFNELWLREIHLRLFNGVNENAGIYKDHSIDLHRDEITVTVHQNIEGSVQHYINELHQKPTDPIQHLAATHISFMKAQPFIDGNDTVARIILTAQALRLNLFPPILLKERETAYKKYIAHVISTTDTSPLEYFLAESISNSAQLLLKA